MTLTKSKYTKYFCVRISLAAPVASGSCRCSTIATGSMRTTAKRLAFGNEDTFLDIEVGKKARANRCVRDGGGWKPRWLCGKGAYIAVAADSHELDRVPATC